MQVGRAVAVDDALGPAGGAARVAHRRRLPLVEIGPVEALVRAGEQLFVAQRARQPGAVSVADDDEVLDPIELVRRARQHRHQARVDDDEAVARVLDEIGHLLGKEPEVDGVQHRAEPGYRQVGFEVLLRVPRKGAHAIADGDTEPAQRRREPAHARRDLAEAGAARGALLERGHLAAGVHGGAVAKEAGDGQRNVLHGAVHVVVSTVKSLDSERARGRPPRAGAAVPPPRRCGRAGPGADPSADRQGRRGVREMRTSSLLIERSIQVNKDPRRLADEPLIYIGDTGN